jgi:hypothetical protein
MLATPSLVVEGGAEEEVHAEFAEVNFPLPLRGRGSG